MSCQKDIVIFPEPSAEQLDIVISSSKREVTFLNSDLLKSAPQSPQNLSVTDIGETTVDLDWDDLTTPFDDYTIYVQNTTTDTLEQTITGISLSEVQVMGLTTDDDYEFWVTSVRDDIESEESNHVTATPVDTTAPDPPENVSLLEEGDGFVRVGADPSPSSDVVGYNAYQDDGGGAVQDNGALLTETEISDYSFDNVTNDTTYEFWFTAEDEAGNESVASTKVQGTPSGVVANSRSLSFDGDDWVNMGDVHDINNSSQTWMCWFKTPGQAAGNFRLIEKRGQGSLGGGFPGMQLSANWDFTNTWLNTLLEDDSGNTVGSFSGTNNFDDDTWHHVALVWDSDNGVLSLYLDFTLFDSDTNSAMVGANCVTTRDFELARANTDAQYYIGKLDEVQVWNKALTETEITDFGNKILDGDETDLIGYWNCEDENSDLTDLTANNNHGTINGATYSTDVKTFS